MPEKNKENWVKKGLKDGYSRLTIACQDDHIEKLKALAGYRMLSMVEIHSEALTQYFKKNPELSKALRFYKERKS